jgi:GNAT superfamily N-acetyltransferase
MADLAVRRYERGDAARVWALHVAALRDAGTDTAVMPEQDDLRDVTGAYLDTGGEFLVGEREGHIVATGALDVLDEDTGELRRMRVDPAHQGKGYGTRILCALEATARDRGVTDLVLDTAVRQGAVPFYRSRGYEVVGSERWRAFELVSLRKRLDAGRRR